MKIIFQDRDPGRFLDELRKVEVQGSVQYLDSGRVTTFSGLFSLWASGGVVLHLGNEVRDVLSTEVKEIQGIATFDGQPVKITLLPEEQLFIVKN